MVIILCRAVTGSGFSKRELFTNDDDIIYSFKRCIGFNGINLGATRGDLFERGLIIELERIPKERRRKLEDIWIEFDKIKPQLLGYIFDTLVIVLRKKKVGGIQLEGEELGHPRMADFAEIAEIISRSMEYSDNQFLKAYNKNIGLQTQEAIEANPVASTIIKFINQVANNYWIGTDTQLLNELDTIADQELRIKISKVRSWPKSPASLSRRLKEVKTPLRETGIIIERPVETNTNTKLIEIRKISPQSPVRPEVENQAQKEHDNSPDILGGNGLSSEICPEIKR